MILILNILKSILTYLVSFAKMLKNNLQYLLNQIATESSPHAFNELFRYYFPGLLSFACKILKNKQVSEEIVEDVFIKLWENRNVLPTIKNLSHYLYISTKHASFNYLKSKDNVYFEDLGESFTYSIQTPETQMVGDENTKIILEIINSLPPKCRLIFRLIKDEAMTYQEVAQLLNLSVRTINTQMTIALSRIIDGLEHNLPELSVHYSRKKSG